LSTSTTSFDDWMGNNKPDGHEDIYALYNAVAMGETFGTYDVVTDGDKTFIKGPVSTLVLVSEKARNAFLKEVEGLKDDPEMDMESWYGFKVAISKDNS